MRKILFFILSFPLLLNSQIKELWGVTSSGGVSSDGVIFKTDANGENIQVIHNFTVEFEGKNPCYSTLVESVDGKLYGMTQQGGLYNKGILFEFDPSTNTYIKKIDFGLEIGENPWGSLTKTTNGKLYGMTNRGGTNDKGVIFEYDPTQNSINKLFDFDEDNGSMPYGSLLLGTNNNLYGLTNSGGVNGVGVLFEFNITTKTFSKKIDFNTNNGKNPYGDLIQLPNGKLYGMTYSGGANSGGVIFEYDINENKLANKFNFQRNSSGAYPFGSLLKASNGKLYGMTHYGGTSFIGGTLFEYDPVSNIFAIKQKFSNSAFGIYPYGNLIELENGILLGLTSAGGTNGYGVLFDYNIASETYTKKIDFTQLNTGSSPLGTLFKAKDGKLYGFAAGGGSNNYGVLFEYQYNSNCLIKKIDFHKAINGNNPYTLTQAAGGKIYGVTTAGGEYGRGILFEIDPINNQFIKKFDFDGTNGSRPYGKLLFNTDNNKLYGTTSGGGLYYQGTFFEYDPANNIFTKKIDFNETNGNQPTGNIIKNNDKIYGVTWSGGQNNGGVLYEYDLNSSTLNKKIDFDYNLNGALPSSIKLSTTGKIYGTTAGGGQNNNGTFFDYNPNTNVLNNTFNFDQESGSIPRAAVIESYNGRLYGTTSTGGLYNFGVIYEYEPDQNIYIKKLDFNNENGSSPFGNMIFKSDNTILGLTAFGGNYNSGVLFKYDLNNSTYTKKVDFNGVLGAVPFDIIEITKENLSIKDQTFKNTNFIYPNPTTGTIFIKNTEVLSFELFSLDGKMINFGKFDKSYQIDLSNCPSGNYILKLKTKDNKEITQKIIKK